MSFAALANMEVTDPNENNADKKFHLLIDGKTVYVETISATNQIYVVEFPGHDSFFITKIRNNNRSLWISMPQGKDELAATVGSYIDERHHSII
jgi:hypothetical protein